MTWLFALIAILAVAGLVVMSSKSTLQTPPVGSDRKSESAAKRPTQSNDHASQQSPIGQKNVVGDAEREADKDSEKRAEEAREYWPFHIFGARLKITDSLLAVFTFLLIIVGAIQGVFLYRTDQGTHKAADAAQKSAEVSERALIVTQRAVVRVLGFPWLWRPDTDPKRAGKYWYDITPNIENTGNAATQDAKINVNYELRDTALPPDFDFPFKGVAGDTLIGGKQVVGASSASILDEDLLLIQKGEKFFYIWGTVTYRDGFESTPMRETEFCAYISRVFGNPLDPRDANNPKGTTVEISFGIYPKHQKTN